MAVTGFNGFSDRALDFYEGLRADNSKTYWTAHKQVYEDEVRAPMQALLDSLAEEFGGTATLFRPYRDVRFSADKSPYKTAQGGFVGVDEGVGYWMQLDAEGVMVGGGFHAHDKEQTARYRAAVDDEAAGTALEAIIAGLVATGFSTGGDKVKTKPRGVPADHPRLELMRHESLTVARHVPSRESASRRFATTLAKDWRRITPLIDWTLRYAPPS
jgi:uncharacterized protein (TIGR02453 family)